MYLDDPIPDGSTLTAEQQKLILGGEVCMWAEQITAQTVDSRIWPRTAALTPMGNPVDYTRPDPPAREDFRLLVERYLHSGSPTEHTVARQELDSLFQSWIDSGPALNMIAAQHPKLDQVSLRRTQLTQLGVLGIQSLDAIDSRTASSAERIEMQSALLKAAADHSELTDFVILPPLQQLVDAAGKH
jgi:hexosaminidase